MKATSAFLCAFLVACGGATRPVGTAPKAARQKPVKDDALRHFDRGLRALKIGGAGADEQAAERFRQAVQADASLWEAWHNLGIVEARRGNDRAATEAFGRAAQLNPGHLPARLGRAEANRRLRLYKEARRDYEAILADEDDDEVTRLRLASLLRDAGDHDGSQKQVREVLRRNPGLAAAHLELGLTYLAMNHLDLAELVLGKAADKDAKNPEVWNALALVALARGRDQEAFQRLDHATQLDPSFRDARFNKASVLLDAGDYAQARRELQAALGDAETAPGASDLDAVVALGVAYRGMGELPKAKTAWERVLTVAPMHADALYNLAVLHMDFLRDEGPARGLLQKYLDASSGQHPRRKDAESRLAELSKSAKQADKPVKTP